MRKPMYAFIQLLLFATIVTTTTAQQADRSKDSIIYQVDFNTESEGPNINHADTAFCKIEKGNFIMNIKKASRYWMLHWGWETGHQSFDILEVKFKVQADSQALPALYGLSWNAKETAKNVWDDYMLLLTTDKKFAIFSSIGKVEKSICEWQSNFDVNSVGYNTVRIEARPGNMYRFYCNNEFLCEKQLTAVPLRFAGLYLDPHSMLMVDYVKMGVFKK